MRQLLAILVVALILPAAADAQKSCDALSSLKLEKTTITSAEVPKAVLRLRALLRAPFAFFPLLREGRSYAAACSIGIVSGIWPGPCRPRSVPVGQRRHDDARYSCRRPRKRGASA